MILRSEAMRRAALVIGASSGIGAATCRRADGRLVVGVARRPSPEEGASLCVGITVSAVCSRPSTSTLRWRLLVPDAATTGSIVTHALSDTDERRRAVEINLLGTYGALRVALARPPKATGGLATHLTSGVASKAKPHWSACSASKGGALHPVRSAPIDLDGSACGIPALHPGITGTPTQDELRSVDFPDRARFVRVYETRSGCSPEEVAGDITELSPRDPSAVSGQMFRVGAL